LVEVRVVKAKEPVIYLNGSAIMTQEAGEDFQDPGGYIVDTLQPDLSVHLVNDTDDKLDTGKLGSYVVTYSMAEPDGQGLYAVPVTRVVNVVDTIAPVSHDLPSVLFLHAQDYVLGLDIERKVECGCGSS